MYLYIYIENLYIYIDILPAQPLARCAFQNGREKTQSIAHVIYQELPEAGLSGIKRLKTRSMEKVHIFYATLPEAGLSGK